MPQSDYNVNIIVKTTDKTSGPAKKAAGGLKDMASAVKALAAVAVAQKIARYAVELTKIGAAAQRQAGALDNLAQAAGTSGSAIIKAIQGASDFTIDRMSAMQAANRAMVMDVAQSPEEFERLTKVAVSLGRAMGVDATKAIDDFVTASARQSQMIADNLGLTVTVGAATERYAAKLGVTVDELTDAQKKQAFLNMMLEEGEKKMAALGDGTLDAAGQLEVMNASWTDARTAIGEALVTIAQVTGLLSAGAEGTRKWADDVRAFTDTIAHIKEWGLDWRAFGDMMKESLRGGAMESDAYLQRVEGMDAATQHYTATARAQAEAERTARQQRTADTRQLAADMKNTIATWNQYQAALDETTKSEEATAVAALELAASQEEAAEAAREADIAAGAMAKTQLSLSVSFTRQLGQMRESAEQFAQDREELEVEHREKLAELEARGQAKSVQLNLVAEQEKLAALKWKMEQAQIVFDEMTGKEKESTQRRKEKALTDAQAEYAQQQQLLNDYHAGRLVTAGENVDGLIAEEKRLHDEKLTMIDAQMAKQQEAAQQAMGQLLLQTVDAWAEANGKTDLEMTEMRVGIMEEYGIVEKGSRELVNDLLSELDRWDTDGKVSTDNLISYFGSVVDEQGEVKKSLLELTADEWVIRVRYEEYRANAAAAPPRIGPDNGPTIPMQHGGSFMVGEAGAEMITVQPLSSGDTYYNETYNVANPGTMAAMDETRRRRRAAYGRTM
jgi:hypothetical protein